MYLVDWRYVGKLIVQLSPRAKHLGLSRNSKKMTLIIAHTSVVQFGKVLSLYEK